MKKRIKNPKNSFPNALHFLRRDGSLTTAHLAQVLEANLHKKEPKELREYVVRHLRGNVEHKPGRRAGDAAVLDFDLFDAEALYEERLVHHRGRKRAKSQDGADYMPAQEAALRDVLAKMKDEFENVTWQHLRNMLSKHKRPRPIP